jgi:carbon monoxide dehydrogenase subunit G
MRLEGTRSLTAPRTTVWEVLNDPRRMAELMPGVESFDVKDDRHWRANVKIPLGLGGLRMSIDFEKTEEREPEFAALHAKGNGVGALMDMTTRFELAEDGDATSMRWQADVSIAGPVGSMGQRVLQPIVNQQVQNVLTALDRQVQAAASGAGSQATGDTGETTGPATGGAGTPEPTTERESPETDPELKDAGEPAEGPADPEGTSGGEEGLSPWAPESYSEEPEGPTTSTEA